MREPFQLKKNEGEVKTPLPREIWGRRSRIWFYSLFLGVMMGALSLATAHRACAALGSSPDVAIADREATSVTRHDTVQHSRYSVHEISSASTVVREYVSPSGIVFGIAWNGLMHPDLTHLLGSYAVEYHKALRQVLRNPGRRHSRVETNGIVVQKWGHMRNLQGRAYLSALIPEGVSVDEIR